MPDNMTFTVLDFVEKSAAALEEAAQIIESDLRAREKMASCSTGLVDELQRRGYLPAEQRDEAIEKISTHNGALEVMQNLLHMQDAVVEKTANAKMAANGQGRYVPSIGGNGDELSYDRGGYLGRRSGSRTAADREFARQLGLDNGN